MFHDELLRIWREPQAQVPSLVSRQAELLPSTTQPPQLITGVGVSWRESEHSVLRGGENARPPTRVPFHPFLRGHSLAHQSQAAQIKRLRHQCGLA